MSTFWRNLQEVSEMKSKEYEIRNMKVKYLFLVSMAFICFSKIR